MTGGGASLVVQKVKNRQSAAVCEQESGFVQGIVDGPEHTAQRLRVDLPERLPAGVVREGDKVGVQLVSCFIASHTFLHELITMIHAIIDRQPKAGVRG